MEHQPKFQEICRRYLADVEDFSEEKIQRAGEKEFLKQYIKGMK